MPFRTLAGHRALHALLARAVSRAALPQSLVFAGPEGVGKRSTAEALAQLLNCASPLSGGGEGDPVLDACGQCAACRRIAQRVHPDVVVVPGATSVDDMREVIAAAPYRPFEGRRRVFVLDAADTLSAIVQNALLKTLEEPTATSQFVLVTSRPDMLLPTVRSRCPQLRFGRLPVDVVARLLVEQHGIEPALAREAAFAADGSPGRAITDASEAGSALRGLAERVLQQAAGASPAQRLRAAQALMEPAETKRSGRAPKTRAASERELLGERLDALAALLRDLGVVAAGADDRWLARTPTADLAALAARLGPPKLAAAYGAMGKAREALQRNVSPKVVADWAALQL